MFRNALFSMLAFGLLAAAPLRAHADKEASAVHYKEAKKKYNLGDFDEAIVLFKKAYDEHEAPAYLYNIAQAYRQIGNCKKSLFFYERFLAEKPGSSQEETIKGYVAALQEECPDDGSNVGALNEIDDPVKPAAKLAPPEIKPAPAEAKPTVTKSHTPSEPRGPLVRLAADGGFAMVSMGEVTTPITPELALAATYLHALGDIELRAGARVTLATMAYEAMDGDSTMLMTRYQATVGAGYPIGPKLRVGGDIALGILGLSALDPGNPFTNGAAESEAASNFAFGVNAEVEYALAESLGVSGGLSYGSSGVGDEFASDITSIGTLSLLGGARYRW
jgi:tetratricopeptide (TPR) repeat protein